MSVGVHSVKHNIWKATSVFTLERNLISAQNAVSKVPNPLISKNTWSDIRQQLTSFGLRQHIVIVIYSATPRSTLTTLIFIIIITWYLEIKSFSFSCSGHYDDDGDEDDGDDASIIKLHGTKVLGGWQALNTRRVRPFNVYVYWS